MRRCWAAQSQRQGSNTVKPGVHFPAQECDPAGRHAVQNDRIRYRQCVFFGLAEEITTAFSRFRPIVCVAPASVAALADEPDRQTDRWNQLDLDFLVDGSFRKKGNDIRVLLRLINMRGSGEISWGRRFDSLMPDVLNLQDQIASETAAQDRPGVDGMGGAGGRSRRKSIRPRMI